MPRILQYVGGSATTVLVTLLLCLRFMLGCFRRSVENATMILLLYNTVPLYSSTINSVLLDVPAAAFVGPIDSLDEGRGSRLW